MMIGNYMSVGTMNESISAWFKTVPFFFIVGMVVNIIFCIIQRKEKGNIKAFLITTPVMFLMYVCNLIPLYILIS